MKRLFSKATALLLLMVLTAATAWADDPSWLKQGDSWDATTKTLTVNSAEGAYGAYGNNSVIENVIVGNGVTSIGQYAFGNCTNLKTVFVGNGVTGIGYGAFGNCTSLKTVIMTPSSAPQIVNNSFYQSSNLKIYVPMDNNGNILQAYRQNNVWLDYYNNNYLIGSWMSGTCAAGLKNGVLTVVGIGALEGYLGPNSRGDITSIVIEEGVTSIGDYAFDNCTGLTSIEIPASVTSIGDGAFYRCGSLATITVDENNQAFDSREGCNAIIRTADNALVVGGKNTVIPNSVTSIGDLAFYGCGGLTAISIPDGVTSIGDGAFGACSNLESVNIPDGVTSIAISAFNDCNKLATITVDAGNQTFDSREGCNAIIRKADNTLVVGCKTTVIPNSVTSIGPMAFGGHDGLTSITIPANVTSIGISAFNMCYGLSTVTIGSSVTSIGDRAFGNCDALESVTIYATSVPTLGTDVFYYNKSGRKFYVFSDCVDAYKAAWGTYANYVEAIEPEASGTYANDVEAIAPEASGTCGAVGNEDNVTWQVAGEAGHYRLIISGTGDMAEYASTNDVPWKDYLASITTAAISAGVTTINSCAFNQGTIINLSYTGSVPDGYTFGGYTVTDAGSNPVSVTGNNGVYTFAMPAEDVTISNALAPIDWATESTGADWDHAYMIYNKDQLDLLAERVNSGNNQLGKYFKLGADITYSHNTAWDDATSTENNYTAIGKYVPKDEGTDPDYYFSGYFDGQNHVVSGIRIYKNGTAYADQLQGLFGICSTENENAIAEVKNVILADARITGHDFTGGISGYIDGIMTNCHVLSDVTIHDVSNAYSHGGIVGYNEAGTVSGCTSAASITFSNGSDCKYFGGIVGVNNGPVSDCLYLGNTVEGNRFVGAIVGFRINGTVTNCYFTSTTICGKNSEGGTLANAASAVGSKENNGSVTNCGLAPQDAQDNSNFLTLMAARNAALTAVDRTTPLSTDVDITLSGRTLYKDGDWNTLCLPFSMTAEQVTAQLAPKALMTLGNSEACNTGFDASTGTLNLDFVPANEIEAGVAYIVKWDGDGTNNLVNPRFSGVTIENEDPASKAIVSHDGYVQFVGTYNAIVWNEENKSILFLGDNNTLYWPQPDGGQNPHLNACRAYFQLSDPSGVREFNIDFGDNNEVSGIVEAEANSKLSTLNSKLSEWYTLDGVKLDKAPTRKGLYIQNGRVVVVK